MEIGLFNQSLDAPHSHLYRNSRVDQQNTPRNTYSTQQRSECLGLTQALDLVGDDQLEVRAGNHFQLRVQALSQQIMYADVLSMRKQAC